MVVPLLTVSWIDMNKLALIIMVSDKTYEMTQSQYNMTSFMTFKMTSYMTYKITFDMT